MPQPLPGKLVVDDVVIDFVGQRLLRGGAEQALEPKAFAVLALLAAAPGRVFARDEILDAVWGHRHVTQSVLNRIMSLLRQALGEDAQHPRRLHTVHGIGYRFDLPAGTDGVAAGHARVASPRITSPRRRWLVSLGVVATMATAALLAGRWAAQDRPANASPGPSAQVAGAPAALAVLPFADLSRTGDQAYLADGLAEELLNQLAQAPGLRVVGRTSSFSFRGGSDDLRDIGRQLDVTHVLAGSVRRDGDALRVSAQLIRVGDGSHLWSRIYARQLRDVFAVQEDIARDVAMALSVKLDVARFNRAQGGTTNVEAYERYLRWRSIVMREQLDFAHDRERLQLAREMVALDPQCILCRDALAASLVSMAQEVGGAQGQQLRNEAAQVRQQIGRMAPDSWIARRDRSNTLWQEGRRAEAIALARAIAEEGPPGKERVWDYAYMIYAMGHLDDTVALVEQVRAIEPRALFLSRDLQFDYTAARRYADAEAEYERGLALEGSQQAADYVAFVRQLAGQRPGGLADLRTLYDRLLSRDREFDTRFFHDLGQHLGDRQAMLSRVRRALAQVDYGGGAELSYVPGNIADALGDADLAVAALRRELEARPGFAEGRLVQQGYANLWNSPYSAMRSHPDFKRLLVQAGVVDYWRQTGRWGDGCAPDGPEDFHCR